MTVPGIGAPHRSFHALFGFRVDVQLLCGRFVSDEDVPKLAVEFKKKLRDLRQVFCHGQSLDVQRFPFSMVTSNSSLTLGLVRKMRVANLSTGCR